jgi:hypothetical protein
MLEHFQREANAPAAQGPKPSFAAIASSKLILVIRVSHDAFLSVIYMLITEVEQQEMAQV